MRLKLPQYLIELDVPRISFGADSCDYLLIVKTNTFTDKMLLTFLVALIGIASALYVYLKWSLNYWRRRGVAGPEPRIYTGTFPKTTLMDPRSNYIDETTEIYE